MWTTGGLLKPPAAVESAAARVDGAEVARGRRLRAAPRPRGPRAAPAAGPRRPPPYDAWGNVRDVSATAANPFGFTGHEHDDETGLIYAKARFYDPEVGLFLSEDPAAGDLTNPPSLHRYLYAFQNPTIFVDPSGRAAQARNLAELQEHLADNPEELKALVARFVGEDAAEQVDLPFLAAVLQRTAGGTRLLNLIEDLGLAGSAKPEDFSGEDLAAVRTTLQELITLMDDLEGTVELIMESPREAGAEVVKLLRHQGRKGLELLIAAARGDEAAVFKLERFRKGLLIDATLAAAGGILGEAGGAGSAASGGRRCLDDLFGVFRKLRQRKGIDLRPTKSLRVKTGPGAGTSGGSSGARAVVSEETASVPRGHTEFATPGRFEGVGELSRILREAGVPRSDRLQVINSFRNGQIMLRRATGSENVLRFFGGDARSRGRFVTEGFPQGDARTLLALPPENAATGLTQFRLREGAIFFEGTVGPNFGFPGGGHQIFVPDLEDLVPVR